MNSALQTEKDLFHHEIRPESLGIPQLNLYLNLTLLKLKLSFTIKSTQTLTGQLCIRATGPVRCELRGQLAL